MTAPVLFGQAKWQGPATNQTSHSVTLLTHAVGERLWVEFNAAGSSTHTAVESGWDHVQSPGTTGRQSIFTKIAASTSETLTVTTSSATQATALIKRITASSGYTVSYQIDTAGFASGYGNNTYFGGFSPTAGTQDYLTVTTVGSNGTTVYPSIAYGGTNLYTQAAAGSGGCSSGSMNDTVTTNSISDASFDSNPSAVDWRGYQAVFWEVASGPTPTNYTLTCDTGSYALTGVAATTRRGVRLVADVGSYALTGQAATTSRGYRLTADVGAYTLTGQSATTTRGVRLVANTGAYTLTGHDATLIYGAGPANYSLTCDVGAYSLTGIDATLTYSAGAANYTLACDTGAYALTGVDATLTYTPGTANYSLVCDTGVYSLTGQAAVTSLGRRLIADVGAYSLTGQSATTSVGRRLIADVGAYALTGYDATLTSTSPTAYTLTCETGAYSLTGVDARLTTSVQEQVLSAGFLWMLRRQREMEEALKSVPEQVAEVIKAEAPKVIEKPKAQARNELRRALEQENLPYRAAYTQALERLVQQLRQEQDDDEEEESIAEALLYIL